MSSIPPPPFDPSTQPDYQGWYEMINSIVGFVTASTQLASTLRNSRSRFPEARQFAETPQVYDLTDFPWFPEELHEPSYTHKATPEVYKPLFKDGPLVQFPVAQIANGEPNTEPRTITLMDTKDFGDIQHTPTFCKTAPSDQSCFFEEYTDSEQTIDSANLQVNFEATDQDQNESVERLEEAEQLNTIYDQQPDLQENLVLECEVEEILLVQRSHSKHTKIVEIRDESVETSAMRVRKDEIEECEVKAAIKDAALKVEKTPAVEADSFELKFDDGCENPNETTHQLEATKHEEGEAKVAEKRGVEHSNNKSSASDEDLEMSSIRKLLLIMDEAEDVDGKLNKEFEAVQEALEFKNRLIRRFKEQSATRSDEPSSAKTPGISAKPTKGPKQEIVDHITKNITDVQGRASSSRQRREKANLNKVQARPMRASKTTKPSTAIKEVIPEQKPTGKPGKKSLSADTVKPTRAALPRKQHSKSPNPPNTPNTTHLNLFKPLKTPDIKSCLKLGATSGVANLKTCIIREPPKSADSQKKWLPLRNTTLKMTAAENVKKAAELLKNAEEKVLKHTSEIKFRVQQKQVNTHKPHYAFK